MKAIILGGMFNHLHFIPIDFRCGATFSVFMQDGFIDDDQPE